MIFFFLQPRVFRHPGAGQPLSGRTRRDPKCRQEGQQELFSPIDVGCTFSSWKASSRIYICSTLFRYLLPICPRYAHSVIEISRGLL